jgi:hydrogenase-4 component B
VSYVAASICLILAGGGAVLTLSRRVELGHALFRVLVGGGCLLGAGPAIAALTGFTIPDVRMTTGVPGGPWVFGLDALSGAFLLAIVTVGAACALYGIPYLAGEAAGRAVRRAHALVALLVAALAALVTTRAVMPFLIAWEVMALASYLLIVFEHDRPAVRRAGLLYLVATHASTLALFALFALWGRDARDLTFAALTACAPTLPRGGAAVLGLALVAFGIKAGVVPLHVWLPEAHAAAPSHVSALMSGVVIKMGIYGLLRVVALLVTPPAWWGWLVLTLGVTSGVLGVVWALAQHDIKRLLAFHSVENIGIILLGVGAGALGLAYGAPTIAVLGFGGAILHTLNHALFKSLLFLGAGSVIHATGTRDLDRLGGLATRMPLTATAFLLGSAAIVGLPPLNGFVSEWLIYRSLLRSGVASSEIRIAVLATGALALIGALALACFAKVVGAVFLGRARDATTRAAHEAPRGMTWPTAALAAACVAIGVLPAVVVPPALRVGMLLTGGPATALGTAGEPAAAALTVYMLAVAGGLVAACVLWTSLFGRGRRPAAAETWACGFPLPTPRMQYTSSSFAAPLVAAFRTVAGVHTDRSARAFATRLTDPVLDGLALPAWHGIRTAARWLRPLQRGRVSRALLSVVAAMLVVLVYLMIAGRPT